MPLWPKPREPDCSLLSRAAPVGGTTLNMKVAATVRLAAMSKTQAGPLHRITPAGQTRSELPFVVQPEPVDSRRLLFLWQRRSVSADIWPGFLGRCWIVSAMCYYQQSLPALTRAMGDSTQGKRFRAASSSMPSVQTIHTAMSLLYAGKSGPTLLLLLVVKFRAFSVNRNALDAAGGVLYREVFSIARCSPTTAA